MSETPVNAETDAGLALQAAIYASLRADAAVRMILGDPARIHDDPPTRPVFPYAAFGDARVSQLPGAEGHHEHDVRLRVSSRYRGRREARLAIAAIRDALHDADLPLTGARLVSLRFVFADILRRPDGETFEGVARFRAVTGPP